MLKKTIAYTDYNGIARSETFYFNLTKTEIAKMEISTVGGLTEMLQGIIDANDGPGLMQFFEDFISKAYGEKSPDGKRLIKSREISEAFAQTPAYDVLFMELIGDAEVMAKFVRDIMPAELRERAEAAPELSVLPAN